ncbi:daptomycin-sensing surface protein LiaX [Carnobacterium gallinarum]|uniref:daptomycin-sensing surface protein LiaX n=1 Tax=Carnobacterium gallinarum TaxID=2749 RepID=UPI0005571E37|nr:daptomycin-sensing surface protein LiaX [Carnobacterium gallinarum]
MKERERILELVKQGIISTEEALVLLENTAHKKGKEAVKKDQENVQKTVITKEPTPSKETTINLEKSPEPILSDIDEVVEEGEARVEQEQNEDRARLETILEELANEASGYSVKLDETNKTIEELQTQIKLKKEALMVFETKEELDELTSEDEAQVITIADELVALTDELNILNDTKENLETQLKDVKKQQWGTHKKNISEKFEIPDDWKDSATETMTSVGDKVTEAGTQFGKFMKETFNSVVENVDWKDINIRVPGLATTKFEHEFDYPTSEATILDIKVANGDVVFKNWDSNDIKITAKIKIYGKLDVENPFEAFLERSTIEVDDEHLLFHVPNKRIRCDLTFFLPERTYDHTAVKLLNGNLRFEEFDGKDIYAKSTNGNIVFDHLTATMLETEGVNGNVSILESQIRDLLVSSINGGITARGDIKSGSLSTVNGTVRATLTGNDIQRLEASSVNGTVKVAFPATVSIEGTAKSNLGSIQSRIQGVEIIKEKKDRTNQYLEFRRILDSAPMVAKLSTTTGSILMKDTE